MASSIVPRLPLTQLLTIAFCRFPQPFALACLLPYTPAYLEHLSVPKPEIAAWIGILAATFGVCESVFAIPLTKAADRLGRRPVLLATLCVQLLGNLALGFCTRVWHAVICLLIVGAANGNVAVMRTCVAELVTRDQQARAFSFLPTSAGVGTILGPVIGGTLSTVHLSQDRPYILPNVLSAALFMPGLIGGLLFLDETRRPKFAYQQIASEDAELHHNEHSVELARVETTTFDKPDHETPSPLQSALSKRSKVWLVLNCFIWLNALSGLHSVGFDYMLPIFLQLPPQDSQIGSESQAEVNHPFFQFAGGFGRGAQFTGVLLTIAGVFGILTAAVLYPWLAQRYSHLRILRLVTICFPIVYVPFPYTSLLASSISGIGLCMLLILVKVSLSVMALQSSMILLTNSVSAENVSTIHGVNFMIAGLCRGFGSLSSGILFAVGVKLGYVLIPFWVMAAWGIVTIVLAHRLAMEP